MMFYLKQKWMNKLEIKWKFRSCRNLIRTFLILINILLNEKIIFCFVNLNYLNPIRTPNLRKRSNAVSQRMNVSDFTGS